MFLRKILGGSWVGGGTVWRLGQRRMRPAEEQEANFAVFLKTMQEEGRGKGKKRRISVNWELGFA